MKTRNEVKKVPIILQMETMECGAACLAMILAYYGKWISLAQLRSDCSVSKNGSNAKNIVETARFYGLKAQGKKYNLQKLTEKATFPCILFWGFKHYVVLTGIKGKRYYINDPDCGDVIVDEKDMLKNYTGICMVFEKDENFVPSGHKPSILKYAFKRIVGVKQAFIFMVMALIITGTIEMLFPMFSRVFVDYFLVGIMPDQFKSYIILMTVLCAIAFIVQLISSFEGRKVNAALSIYGSSSFMWRMFHMPISFFAARRTGDLVAAKDDSSEIAGIFVNTLAPIIVNGMLAAFYVIVMVRINPLLAAIGLASIFLTLTTTRLIAKKKENLTRRRMKLKARHSASTISAFRMIESIKVSGAENTFFNDWNSLHTAENNVGVESIKLNNYLGIIPEFLNSIFGVILLLGGSLLIIKGEFGIGSILAFQALYNGMNKPVTILAETLETLQETTAKVERIEDVMSYPLEEYLHEVEPEEGEEYTKLKGKIEIKNVTFGYDRVNPPVISNFSMLLEPGKSVALVGNSGCGKSTVGNLISGLCIPWEGEILYDDKKITEIDETVFRSSLTVVDQDIILFSDSVQNNIKMYDETISNEDMIEGAIDAQIHESIIQRKGGYKYVLRENGTDFSGGERQRIEIARALALKPSILIMDEATSALDSKTEYDLVEAVKKRGCSSVVIAHRLSTIRSCDEIIVLNNGNVLDRGRHEDLMERCEFYRTLVTSE